jgi:membrane protease YdiL (CAAX protease family)
MHSKTMACGAAFAVPALAALAYLGFSHSPFFVSAAIFFAGTVVLTGLAARLLPEGKAALPPIPVANPSREAFAMLAFMALFAVGFLGWGLDQLAAHTAPGHERFVWRIAIKLIGMVILPSAILVAIGGHVREQWRGRFDGPGFWLPVLVLGMGAAALAYADPMGPPWSAVPPSQLWFVAPLSFLWLALEAGLCEEYLFRACLQTRLAAWMKSDAAAISLGALIFGLAHFPGFAWRQPPPGAPGGLSIETLAYCLTAVAPGGLLYGIVWARTRSLWLCVAIHALADIPVMVVLKATWFS